ncbi:MAG: T9SS type A sorting domain-containing protein [Bacteroidota bacterium]
MNYRFRFLLLFVFFLIGQTTFAQLIYTVNNTLDSGPGSLRQAIIESNAHQSIFPDTIRFLIPGNGPHRILLNSTLPVITSPIYINGLTQSGADVSSWPHQLMIELSGGQTVSEGIVISAGRSWVVGLVVNDFTQYGIRLVVRGANQIGHCYIGTDVSGTQARPNGLAGIFVGYYGGGNLIGGNRGQYPNLISGNGRSGIILDSNTAGSNHIKGCYIGTDVSGLLPLPNGGGSGHPDLHRAIYLNNRNSDNEIGGPSVEERNVIAGNLGYGIFINAGDGNNVFNNYIGVGADGKTILGNTRDGVCIYSGSANWIGDHNNPNVIGNNRSAVRIESYSLPAEQNYVHSNFIGQSADGQHALPNTDGISLLGTARNNKLHRNVIKNNHNTGINISGNSWGNDLFHNSIDNNGGLGIDLGNDGVTPNDHQDVDGGPNGQQNFPILTDAFLTADGKIKVTGSINSTPHTNLDIRFFASATCNDSQASGLNYGEGNNIVGSIELLTDNNGDNSFSATLGSAEKAGPYVSAYAIDPDGNTSEFCECVLIDNWPAMHQGTNGPVYAIEVDANGTIYIGGDFTMAGGNSVRNLAKWTGTTWVDVGGGVDSTVFALDTDSQGNLYVGGAFQEVGGGTTARRIALWDGTSWSSVGSGTDGTVRAITVDALDRAYIGGDFQWVEYTLNTGGIVRWNGSTWSSFGNQVGGVRAIALSPSGSLYASGGINLPDPSNRSENIARWNGTTWESLGGAQLFTGPANQLLFDSQGRLYAGGQFLLISGEVYNYIGRYDPLSQQWSKLGNTLEDYVFDMAIDASDRLYIAGKFDYHFDGLAQWDGSSLRALGAGVKLSGPSSAHAMAVHQNYLYVGGNFHFLNTAPANYIGRMYIPSIDLRKAPATIQTVARNQLQLLPAYPNPVVDQLHIPLVLPSPSAAQLEVYDSFGRLVFWEEKSVMPAGQSEWMFSTRAEDGWSAGVYFYRLQVGAERVGGKFVVGK